MKKSEKNSQNECSQKLLSRESKMCEILLKKVLSKTALKNSAIMRAVRDENPVNIGTRECSHVRADLGFFLKKTALKCCSQKLLSRESTFSAFFPGFEAVLSKGIPPLGGYIPPLRAADSRCQLGF